MKPLSFESALEMFPNATPALQQCILDLGGHPRSLKTLRVMLNGIPHWPQIPYVTLMELLLQRVAQTSLGQISDTIVEAALIGNFIKLTDMADPMSKRNYFDCTADGFLLNEIDVFDDRIIPRLSSFQLRLWAVRRIKNTLPTERFNKIAQILLNILCLEYKFDWKVLHSANVLKNSNMNCFTATGNSCAEFCLVQAHLSRTFIVSIQLCIPKLLSIPIRVLLSNRRSI
jgi:hypothetical protein